MDFDDVQARVLINSNLLMRLFSHLLDKRLIDRNEFDNLINEERVSIQKQFGNFLATVEDSSQEDQDEAKEFIDGLQVHLEKFRRSVLESKN